MSRLRFERALERPGLDPRTRFLVSAVVTTVLGRREELEEVLRRASRARVDSEEIREAILQTHLFAGFPRAIEALETLEEARATGAFPESAPRAEGERAGARERGEAFFERVYAERSAAVRERLAHLHPDLERWVVEHAYGRVLGRDGLDASLRELLAAAALLALREWRPLASHLRGAIRLGATRGEVRETLLQAGAHLPAEPLDRATRMLDRVAEPPR